MVAIIGAIIDPNYQGSATNTLVIEQAVFTATADNKSRAYNLPNPPLTISYAGFAHGDDVEDLDSLPTTSTSATTNSPVGEYTITLAGGGDNNYAFNLVNGTLTITEGLAAPLITSVTVENGIAVITWNGTTGRNYRLQYKQELTDAEWTVLSPDIPATVPTTAGTNVVGDLTHRFYRVLVVP